jgi:hypothetical protein
MQYKIAAATVQNKATKTAIYTGRAIPNKIMNYLLIKNGILATIAILVAMSFASCEKVIEVNLEETEKKYVIEGSLSNVLSEAAEVRISQTKSFDSDNDFNGISGATVNIQVNNGSVFNLTETATGIYKNTGLVGMPGSTYTLTVIINGKPFSAISTMPAELVTLDTLTVENFAFGGSESKTIYPSYQDPLGPGNSYRFVQYANGTQVKAVFVQNDNLNDGRRVSRPLLNRDSDLKQNDFVRVDMYCIDPNVYKYWYSLEQSATGENQSATPANPVTNITGGALGYFSAHSVSSKSITIP